MKYDLELAARVTLAKGCELLVKEHVNCPPPLSVMVMAVYEEMLVASATLQLPERILKIL